MFKRIISYYHNTVHPWELWKTRIFHRKSKKLRIGFCGVFPPFQNGAAAASVYILKEFAKRAENDIEIYLIPIKGKFDKKLFSFMNLLFTTVNDTHLDVIIFWCLGDDFEKYSRGATAKKIVWQTMHHDPATNPREQQTFDPIKKADLILSTTKWAYECYKKQVSQVQYLPCGVDTALFSLSEEQKKEKKKKPFTCLFVSRANYYKGIMPFLDTIQYVLEKDKTVFFRIVSPQDENSLYLEEILQRIKEIRLKYPKNVEISLEWIPYDEIPALYQLASVFIFPSNNEGFGIPLIEAMNAEVPCIVLDKKPMSEIVTNEQTGFCLQPSKEKKYHDFEFPNPKDMAEKIIFLKENPQKREAIGRNAREKAVNEYSISDVIKQLINHCRRRAEK